MLKPIVAGVYFTGLAGVIVGAPTGNVNAAGVEYTFVRPPSPPLPDV